MVKLGQKAYVHYVGTLEDGSVFDSSKRRGHPHKVIVGSRKMPEAFERAVADMEVGETTNIVISAADAFGDYDPELVKSAPVERVKNAENLPVGQYVMIGTEGGPARVKIDKIEDGLVYFDYNHELAGHELHYEIELIEVEDKSAIIMEQRSHGCGCGSDRLQHSLNGECNHH